MSKKKYLTGWVHRLNGGVLESYGPGEIAPDWVTNPDLVTEHVETPEVDVAQDEKQEADDAAKSAPAGDDLDGLDGKSLKAIADELGLAKNGSLDAIRERIRAKRAESTPAVDEDHAALVEHAKSLGFEDVDDMSDTELQVLIEGA